MKHYIIFLLSIFCLANCKANVNKKFSSMDNEAPIVYNPIISIVMIIGYLGLIPAVKYGC